MRKVFAILILLWGFSAVAQEATPLGEMSEACVPMTREEALEDNINFYNEEIGYSVGREFRLTVPNGLSLTAMISDDKGKIVGAMIRNEGTVAELPYGGSVWLYQNCTQPTQLSDLLSNMRNDLANMDLTCAIDLWGDARNNADLRCVPSEDECIIHDSFGWQGVEGATRTFQRSGEYIIIVLWRDDYTSINYLFTVPSWVNASLEEKEGEEYMAYIFTGECSHEYANVAAEQESVCKRVYLTDTLRLEECAY